MAPITTASTEATHTALMDALDIHHIPKPFRKPTWKPPQRRNKNVRQIISEASRKELSTMPTEDNSGASTPVPGTTDLNTPVGAATPANPQHAQPNIAQASRDLRAFVAARNAQNGSGTGNGSGNGTLAPPGPAAGPAVTYTNIESAPSLHPSSQRHYCDITGLAASYTDPKSRLRYHNGEVFAVVRTLPQGSTEGYLGARGAMVVLK